jgi:hypothetical protein
MVLALGSAPHAGREIAGFVVLADDEFDKDTPSAAMTMVSMPKAIIIIERFIFTNKRFTLISPLMKSEQGKSLICPALQV